jgi:hypothetical protein
MISKTRNLNSSDADSWNMSLIELTKTRLGFFQCSGCSNARSEFGLTTPVHTSIPFTSLVVP